jgi:DNA-directed RNA polymerase subunit omega
MARITSQRAVEASGGNRYMLVLMAAQRTKELINGSRPRIEVKGNSKSIIALKEIEQGLYTRKEFLESIPKPVKKKGYRDEYFPT